ncbi:MAG: hypothetical protein E6J02_01430 [Chloroflexi bacterium]|nr:MAG: hypothetical protein E6J02_01430 [Chloroflexota bacterium]
MAQATTSTGAENVRWDLSDLYTSPTDPQIEAVLAEGLEQAERFEADYRGRVTQLEPGDFARMFEQLEQMQERVSLPAVYAQLLHSQNTADPAAGRLVSSHSSWPS